MKTLKSPIQYTGGKGWLFKTFSQYLPSDTKEVVSPFFGGGAVEINLAHRGIKVYGFDLFEPVVNFWNQFVKSPSEFVLEASQLLESEDRDYFTRMHNGEYFNVACKRQQSLLFFLINRMAFRAITFNDYSLRTDYKRALSPSILSRISEFNVDGFSVSVSDAFDTIDKYPDHFLFLDPPYPKLAQCLYGDKRHKYHRDFDHILLFRKLRYREKWILCYNDIDYVRSLYDDFEMLPVKRWGDGGTSNRKELLIFSRDIMPKTIYRAKQLYLFEEFTNAYI